jgi:hypothetical protein
MGCPIDTTWVSRKRKKKLARVRIDRREADRRDPNEEATLSSLIIFERHERAMWRSLDRRLALRRQADVRRRIAAQ